MASNQKPGAVALDLELERVRIGFDHARDLPLLAHQLQDSRQDLSRLGGLLLEVGAAPRSVGIFVAVAAVLALAIIARFARRSLRLLLRRLRARGRLLRTRPAPLFSQVGPIFLPAIFSAIVFTIFPAIFAPLVPALGPLRRRCLRMRGTGRCGRWRLHPRGSRSLRPQRDADFRLPRAQAEHARARSREHLDRDVIFGDAVSGRSELFERLLDRFFHRRGGDFDWVGHTHAVAGL